MSVEAEPVNVSEVLPMASVEIASPWQSFKGSSTRALKTVAEMVELNPKYVAAKDILNRNPQYMYASQTVGDTVGGFKQELRSDWENSSNIDRPWSRTRTAASGIGALGVLGAGAAKLPLIGNTILTTFVAEQTHSALAVGAVASALYGANTRLNEWGINNASRELPNTFQAVGNKARSAIDSAKNILPGYEITRGDEPLIKHLGKNMLMRPIRGFVAGQVTSLGYLGTAAFEALDDQDETSRPLAKHLWADVTASTGLLYFGAAEAIPTHDIKLFSLGLAGAIAGVKPVTNVLNKSKQGIVSFERSTAEHAQDLGKALKQLSIDYWTVLSASAQRS